MQTLTWLVVGVTLTVPTFSQAALWSDETSQKGHPGTNNLITGNFIRHSATFYEWRIQQFKSTNQADLISKDYDDLAVAYFQLGQLEQAIETIHLKMDRWKLQGRFESEANLGSFLFYAGRFQEALVHLKLASEMETQASTGRELYHKLITEYVLQQQAHNQNQGFTEFLLKSLQVPPEDHQAEKGKAISAIQSLLFNDRHHSPILLEALADLYLSNRDITHHDQFATKALLMAAENENNPEISNAYHDQAIKVLNDPLKLPWLERELNTHIQAGKSLLSKIRTDESRWQEAGLQLDSEFEQKYLSSPHYEPPSLTSRIIDSTPIWFWYGRLLLIFCLCIFLIFRMLKHKPENHHSLKLG